MNKLKKAQRVAVVKALVEGSSIRSTCRMTGTAKGTVLRLLAELGKACADYQDLTLRNLPCKRVQCDEIWSFVGAKDKNLPKEKRGQFGLGSVWTWTAICSDTKLAISWVIGDREAKTASIFMNDLASRLKHRVQLTTDGLKAYLQAVEDAFADEIDYATLIKLYGAGPQDESRYSPPKCIGIQKEKVNGGPDLKHVSTSFVERQNLTMRMSMRRFTRLTNAFSKKVDNHWAAVCLHFMYYNFCRIHQTLRITPAMAAGVADHVWEVEELIALLDSK